MNRCSRFERLTAATLLLATSLWGGQAMAVIEGIHGPTFNLTAKEDYISLADGNAVLMWGYADSNGSGVAQYPGPTLIVNEGDVVTINLTNNLPAHGADQPLNVSMIFPGQSGVTASGGVPGMLTREAPADGSTVVSYSFIAARPGTYQYQSGTRSDLEVEMGLVGTLVVRPNFPDKLHTAYGSAATHFDHEYLFVLTEMDVNIHTLIEAGQRDQIDFTAYHTVQWFINGRNGPDTLLGNNVPWLPTQPYGSVVLMHPGDKVLGRVVGAGHELHPFHTHGNDFLQIAHNGRLLESAAGAGPDLAVTDYTLKVVPGETYDFLFEWTGKGLGWDIYGHKAGDALEPNEYAPDHGKPIPVTLPNALDLHTGGVYSGSPYLGATGILAPGSEGGNTGGGYFYMWHSHTERELTNNNIFPGGMLTMLVVMPSNTPIP